jgi:hypothetical protein
MIREEGRKCSLANILLLTANPAPLDPPILFIVLHPARASPAALPTPLRLTTGTSTGARVGVVVAGVERSKAEVGGEDGAGVEGGVLIGGRVGRDAGRRRFGRGERVGGVGFLGSAGEVSDVGSGERGEDQDEGGLGVLHLKDKDSEGRRRIDQSVFGPCCSDVCDMDRRLTSPMATDTAPEAASYSSPSLSRPRRPSIVNTSASFPSDLGMRPSPQATSAVSSVLSLAIDSTST